MLGPLSQRILTLLQLTRMALVFTAIADGAAEVLLRAGPQAAFDAALSARLGMMALASLGLYGFGMSLNDIIDRRRDAGAAAHRPLPSGRVRLMTAYVTCGVLAALALGAGLGYVCTARTGPTAQAGALFLLITGLLIVFYNFGGKYFLAAGLLSLGLIRFSNAALAAPSLPVLWHPLLLLNHVAILSMVAYDWEQKRPALTPAQRWRLLGALAALDAVLIAVVAWWRGATAANLPAVLNLRPGLLLPVAAVGGFVLLAAAIRRRAPTRRDAGQQLMLCGLLWLIVYDASFVAGYVGWIAGACLLVLLPVAWWSVQLMRWWSKLLSLSHRPVFQRART
jgi:4-hydroxybenzoate polyprenyltransferase